MWSLQEFALQTAFGMFMMSLGAAGTWWLARRWTKQAEQANICWVQEIAARLGEVNFPRRCSASDVDVAWARCRPKIDTSRFASRMSAPKCRR